MSADLRVLLEGPKLSGKTEVAQRLVEHTPTATFMEFRDYFWSRTDPTHRPLLPASAMEARVRSVCEFLASMVGQAVCTRAHLYPEVALRLTTGRGLDHWREWDRKLAQADYGVVVLDVIEDALTARRDNREHGGRQTAPADSFPERFRRERAMYARVLEESAMSSLVIDTSNQSVDETAEAIVAWYAAL